MRLFIIAGFLTVACLTFKDVKNNVCWALCRQDTYDTGYYDKAGDSCICGLKKSYKDATDKALRIAPHRAEPDSPGKIGRFGDLGTYNLDY